MKDLRIAIFNEISKLYFLWVISKLWLSLFTYIFIFQKIICLHIRLELNLMDKKALSREKPIDKC